MFRTLLISMFITSTALAATWTVDDDGKADFDNIQAAVDAASAGDEIIVMPGTYFQDPKNLILLKNKPLWLHSSDGPEATIIDCLGKCRAIDGWGEAGTTLIEGFTIKNGNAPIEDWGEGGGGIRWVGDSAGELELILRDCIFESNETVTFGGGCYIRRTVLTIEGCVFSNNVANDTGAGWGQGGGIAMSGYTGVNIEATIRNTNFIHNKALGNAMNSAGGGLSCGLYQLTLIDCTFDNNYSDCWAGGCGISETLLFAEGCEFINNRASLGAGVYIQDPNFIPIDSHYPATFTNCTFEDNFADVSNGFNVPALGGGMLLNHYTQTYVNNCTFTNNIAKDYKLSGAGGGGIACWPQTDSTYHEVGLTVSDCIFNENEAEIDGGGIWIQSFVEPINGTDQALIQMQWNRNSLVRSSVSSGAATGVGEKGACCLPPEGYCEYLTENECNSTGGIWYGQLTSCFTTNCSREVLVSGTDFYCNLPTDIDGDYTDKGGNTFADECPECPDINGDGDVNVTDLLAVIDQWGLTDSPADVTGDGVVNVSDVLLIISNWGPCE